MRDRTNERRRPRANQRLTAEARRDLILVRSKELFARYSYLGASTGMLAEACGITEPMLYKHFGSKKGLFRAVLDRYIHSFLADWQARVEKLAQTDLRDAFGALPRTYYEQVLADPDIPKLILHGIVASADDSEVGQTVYRYQSRVFQVVAALIGRAREAGLIDPGVNLEAASWGYVSMILAVQFSQMIQSAPQSPIENPTEWSRQTVKNASELWLRALHPAGP